MTPSSSGPEAALNPQPLPPVADLASLNPQPQPWSASTTAILAAAAVADLARRAGDDRFALALSDAVDDWCPVGRPIPGPKPGPGGGDPQPPDPPITFQIGVIRDLLSAAAALPASGLRGELLGQSQRLVGKLARRDAG